MSTKEQPQQDDSEWRFVPSHDVGGKAVPEYWENDNGDRHYGDIPPRPTPSPSLPDEGATTRVDHVVFSAGHELARRNWVEADFARQLERELAAAQRERDEAKDQLAGRVAVPDSPLRHDEWVRLLEKERTRAETAEAQIEDYKRAYNECWAGSPAVKTELDKLRTQSSHVEEMAKALEEIFSYKTADHDMIVDEEFLAPHRAVVARYRSAQKENTL